MRRVTSSSFPSRRLKIVFAALFPLVSIHLVGGETLNELAIKHQSETVRVDKPQLEIVFSDVEFSLDEWAFQFEVESPSYLPLSIDPISISLLDDETSSKKTSPFRVKKTINFNREIAKNEQEKLSLTFREKGEDPLLANPNIEKKIQNKHDFLSEKLTFEMEKGKHKETSPFAFKETKEKSDLINRRFSHKKIEPSPSKPSEKIKTAQPSRKTHIASKSKKEEEFSPEKEGLSKHAFEEDQAIFCFDETVIESEPFSFEDHAEFDEKLSRSSLPKRKENLVKRSDFADKYFKNLEWGDYSRLTQKSALIVYSPTREEGKMLSKIEQKEIFLELTHANPSEIFFDDISVTLSYPSSSYRMAKKSDLKPHLDETSFGELPYYSVKSASQEKIKENYIPSKEKATPLPSKYSISKGPTLALELNDHVIAFAITPEFDLYAGENRVELPKKVQEFQTSALALLEPYIDVKKEVRERSPQINPTPESHQALALVERDQTLDLGKASKPSDSFSLKGGEEHLPIISHSLEFPHHTAEKQTTEFPIEDRAYLSTLMEKRDHEVLMTPSVEDIPSATLEKSFEFDLTDHKNHQKFSFSEDEKLEIASRKHPKLPKKELGHTLSDLPIHSKEYRTEEIFVSAPQTHEDYIPSVQKSKTLLHESSFDLSISDQKGVALTFEYPRDEKDIDLLGSGENVEKFESATQTVLGSLEFNIPNVKQKDVSPKADRQRAEKVAGDIPEIKKMQVLVARGGRKLNIKEFSTPAQPSEEEEQELALKHPLHRPSLPAYFPPEGLESFNFETSYSAIKEEQLNLTKQKIAPVESSVEELNLPYVVNKKVIPNKAPFVPEKALEDLPEVKKMVELANRDENYPNARKLLEKEPLPVPVKNEIAINVNEVADVETEMIHSQAKEIVEDYDQENRYSHGLIALESPTLELGPKGPEAKSLNKSSRFTNGFLTEIPPPSHLETVTYANEFESEVHYTKREDGKGYYFAIKLKPGEKLNFASPSQNYIFVVDGSSSIKKHRFGVFKDGVARALSYLSEADSFNIVVADAKMRSFSDSSTSWNKGSVAKAKKFLMDQDFRGFFVNYDAFDLISKVTQYFTPDKENIVVLITDGNSFQTLRDHKDDFKELSEANKGKFSIFTATASQGNNLSMLDLLSTFNNGELMYSKTNASFSRQLSVLVKHIESFVAKNVHINVTGAALETGIEFYPNEKTLPSLYADRPYMIYGSIDELKDFDIILQGRAGEQWINVKQSISFQHAIAASHSIKKGMALQKAYVCYDYFMKNEDAFFLSEAQKILEPFNIPTAMR